MNAVRTPAAAVPFVGLGLGSFPGTGIHYDVSRLAVYLLNAETAGRSPQAAADTSGGRHHLNINFNGEANWFSDAQGRGLEFNDISGNALAIVNDNSAANSIGGQANGARVVWLICKASIRDASANVDRLVFLGQSGGDGEIMLGHDANLGLVCRFGEDSAGGNSQADFFNDNFEGTGMHVFIVQFDSTQVVANDRCRVWVDSNANEIFPTIMTIDLNRAIVTQAVDMGFVIGNRTGGGREMDSVIKHVQLGLGTLSPELRARAFSVLSANDDVDPFVV